MVFVHSLAHPYPDFTRHTVAYRSMYPNLDTEILIMCYSQFINQDPQHAPVKLLVLWKAMQNRQDGKVSDPNDFADDY